MVALSDGSMLRTRGGELSAMDLASGKTRWTTTLPSDPDGDASLRVRAVALAPAGWIVVDSAARVFTVRPSSCAEHRSSCYEPMGRLPDDEPLDEVEMLVHAELLWVREHATLRALTTDGLETRFVARAHERVGWVADHPGGIVTIIDDEVMVLDPASCRGAEVVAPSTWPRPGRPVAPELDACPDCAAPPPGCVAWRAHVRDIDPSPPVVLDDGTIVVHDDRGFTLGLRDGETRWKSATAGSGPTLRHDGALLVLGTGFAEGDHLVIWGLSGDDGRHQFETPLPFAVDGVVHALDDFAFARTDDLVVAAYRTELVAVDLTQRD